MVRYTGFIASISGFVAVAMGAFGAHALKASLSAPMLEVYRTAVHYHFVHTLVLLLLALLLQRNAANAWLRRSSLFFMAGIVLFCGSLYLLAISSMGVLGMVTPLGGVAFLLGWLSLAVAFFSLEPEKQRHEH